jgi:hypothetical protein
MLCVFCNALVDNITCCNFIARIKPIQGLCKIQSSSSSPEGYWPSLYRLGSDLWFGTGLFCEYAKRNFYHR